MNLTGPTKGRLLLAAMIAGGLTITVLTLLFARSVRDPVGLLFQHGFTGPLMVLLLIWALTAAGIRRLLLGRGRSFATASKVMIFWIILKISVFVSIACLAVGWLFTSALGYAGQTTALRALVVMMIVSAFDSLLAGAIANSALLLRHCRARIA